MITRAGLRKSLTASPSFKNSGFDATAKGWAAVEATASWTLSAVPTGTVLFVMMTA